MKKVVLIVPESVREASPISYSPLGLLYIAASVEKAGYEAVMHDMRNADNIVMSDLNEIPESKYYCITATTNQYKRSIQIINHIRKNIDRNAFIVAGGPHAAWMAQDYDTYADCIVRGEGDHEIGSILDNKRTGVINASLTAKKSMIDDIPFPARHLMPRDRIVSRDLWAGYNFGKGEVQPEATTLISSRGCPYACTFCSNIIQTTRLRSVDNFIAEIEKVIEDYGCRHYRFLDDVFTVHKKRLFEFCDKVENMDIHFRISTRSDLITDEICEYLKKAGCEECGLGVESGDPTVLKLLNKKETAEDHERAIKIIKSHGIRVKAFLMAGLPGETWQAVENTKKFIEKTMPDKFICTLFTPYPGNPIWSNPKAYGVKILNYNLDEYYQLPGAKSNIETDLCSSEELNEHYEELQRFLREVYGLTEQQQKKDAVVRR